MTMGSSGSLHVRTSHGTVRGRPVGRCTMWRSIPYAASPVGALRFRAPQPPVPWTGIYDAGEFTDAAIQVKWGAQVGIRSYQRQSEDCLTINVTAPARASERPRAVMVFIHGGGYVFGTSALPLYAGNSLALHGDVIVVSFNYRLNVFGYADFTEFATADYPIQSNLGLRDQVAALQWVRENIAAFGGDPGNVTIFGESAGAAAVTTLLATPAAAGLFHRAIAQSSPADWAQDAETAARIGRRTIENLQTPASGAAAVLRNAMPHDLRRAHGRTIIEDVRETPGVFTTVPVVDGDFLPKHPLDALADGSAHRVPLIIGTNRNEGSLFAKYLDDLPTTPDRIAAMFTRAQGPALESVAAHYAGYPRGHTPVQLGGDYMFLRPTLEAAAAHSAYAPTYHYRYDFTTPVLRRMGLAAAHATELIPVFGLGSSPLGRGMTALGGRRDLTEVSRKMQGHWLSFANYGAPLASWPAYDTSGRQSMVFDSDTRVVADLNRDRRLAWSHYRRPYAAAPA